MNVDVLSTALRTGALLELGRCARHGVPATRARTRRFTTDTPGIVLALALFSFFLVLLVAAAFRKDVSGPVPECERCARTYRRRVTVLWLGVIGAPALVVVALFLRNGWVGVAGLVFFLLGIGSGIAADLGRARGTLDSDLAWVHLRGVDPAFAAAVRARVHDAPQPDPWVTPLA